MSKLDKILDETFDIIMKNSGIDPDIFKNPGVRRMTEKEYVELRRCVADMEFKLLEAQAKIMACETKPYLIDLSKK